MKHGLMGQFRIKLGVMFGAVILILVVIWLTMMMTDRSRILKLQVPYFANLTEIESVDEGVVKERYVWFGYSVKMERIRGQMVSGEMWLFGWWLIGAVIS